MIISALMLLWWLRALGDESADVFVRMCVWVTDSIYTAEHWGQKVGGGGGDGNTITNCRHTRWRERECVKCVHYRPFVSDWLIVQPSELNNEFEVDVIACTHTFVRIYSHQLCLLYLARQLDR